MSQVGLGGILLTLTGSPVFTTVGIAGGGSLWAGPTENYGILASPLLPGVTGDYNIAIASGFLALTTGSFNIGIGFDVNENAITASHNIGMGYRALANLQTGVNNIAIGSYALAVCNGDWNVCIGYTAGYQITAGYENTAIGNCCLVNCTSGAENTGVGAFSLEAVITGGGNTALGHRTGQALTVGSKNLHLGWGAGWGTDDAVGSANKPQSDDEGILIGYLADRSVPTATVLTNYCGLGNRVQVDKSQQFKLGPDFLEINLGLAAVPIAANNAAAAIANVLVGGLYRTNADPSIVCIRSA